MHNCRCSSFSFVGIHLLAYYLPSGCKISSPLFDVCWICTLVWALHLDSRKLAEILQITCLKVSIWVAEFTSVELLTLYMLMLLGSHALFLLLHCKKEVISEIFPRKNEVGKYFPTMCSTGLSQDNEDTCLKYNGKHEKFLMSLLCGFQPKDCTM